MIGPFSPPTRWRCCSLLTSRTLGCERTAYAIVADLTEAGYVVKERDGRRNRYHIQRHLPLRDEIGRERSLGELLDLLGATEPGRKAGARR